MSKWSNIDVLFNNGKYQLVLGHFQGNYYPETTERLGERYPDFPKEGFYFAVPPFLEVPILRGLLDKLERHPEPGERGVQRRARIQEELAKRST